jgi:hypothetical protein
MNNLMFNYHFGVKRNKLLHLKVKIQKMVKDRLLLLFQNLIISESLDGLAIYVDFRFENNTYSYGNTAQIPIGLFVMIIFLKLFNFYFFRIL